MLPGVCSVRKTFLVLLFASGLQNSHAARAKRQSQAAAPHDGHFWPKRAQGGTQEIQNISERNGTRSPTSVASGSNQSSGKENETVKSELFAPAPASPHPASEIVYSAASRTKESLQQVASFTELPEARSLRKMLDEVLPLLRVVVFQSSLQPSIVFPALLLGISISIVIVAQIAIPWVVFKIHTGLDYKNASITSKLKYNIDAGDAFNERLGIVRTERYQAIVSAICQTCCHDKVLLACPNSDWVDVDCAQDGPADEWEPLHD